jgi:hypothetical protein
MAEIRSEATHLPACGIDRQLQWLRQEESNRGKTVGTAASQAGRNRPLT